MTFYFQIRNVTHFWRWMKTSFIPAIFTGDWYNDQEEKIEEYIGNKRSILVGMPRLRQLRVVKGIIMAICLIFVRCLRYTCFSFFLTFSLILLNCFFLIKEAIVHRVMCAILRFYCLSRDISTGYCWSSKSDCRVF